MKGHKGGTKVALFMLGLFFVIVGPLANGQTAETEADGAKQKKEITPSLMERQEGRGKIKTELDKKISVNFDDTGPLNVFRFLQNTSDLDINVSSRDLPSGRVTLKYNGPARELLDRVCKHIGTTWVVKNDAVAVGIPERFTYGYVSRGDPVPEKLNSVMIDERLPLPGGEASARSVLKRFQKKFPKKVNVYWEDIGPDLVVKTVPGSHGKVTLRGALIQMAAQSDIGWGCGRIVFLSRHPRPGSLGKRLQEELETEIQISFDKTPLKEICHKLQEQPPVSMRIRLECAESLAKRQVTLQMRGSIRDAVTELCRKVNLSWTKTGLNVIGIAPFASLRFANDFDSERERERCHKFLQQMKRKIVLQLKDTPAEDAAKCISRTGGLQIAFDRADFKDKRVNLTGKMRVIDALFALAEQTKTFFWPERSEKFALIVGRKSRPGIGHDLRICTSPRVGSISPWLRKQLQHDYSL
ncbi:MAG: hypothetical protein KGZ25_05140, partial [Planctomycetes bacterium]|nr:hypothetical protein [Planctomycetota bacterium]